MNTQDILQDRLQSLFPVHHRSGNILLINADCMDVLKHIKDREIELCIVDPPYGINAGHGIGKIERLLIKNGVRRKNDWDSSPPPLSYFEELRRISVNQIIWGGNYFPLPSHRCYLVWDKGESMYGRDFADCEQAWTSFDKLARIYKLNPMQLNKIHPTQKPVKLYEWLLKNYANKGDKILDTHGGSFSLAIACYNLDLEFTGIELDSDYYKAAVERFEEHKKQIRLFNAL